MMNTESAYTLDLRDVRGQMGARRALEIAAAGGHHLLMMGPPGCGKTMLAMRLPELLPTGAGGAPCPLRAPHHTAAAIWQATHAGGREAKNALRLTLFKYRLHQDADLFDRAYGYIREYY